MTVRRWRMRESASQEFRIKIICPKQFIVIFFGAEGKIDVAPCTPAQSELQEARATNCQRSRYGNTPCR